MVYSRMSHGKGLPLTCFIEMDLPLLCITQEFAFHEEDKALNKQVNQSKFSANNVFHTYYSLLAHILFPVKLSVRPRYVSLADSTCNVKEKCGNI